MDWKQARREVRRLFGVFKVIWNDVVSGLDYGPGAVFTGSDVWEELGITLDHDCAEFGSASSLRVSEDYVQADEFSILVYIDERPDGWVIAYDLGYIRDGDDVAGTSGKKNIQSIFQPGVTESTIKNLIQRAHSSIGQIPEKDESFEL